MCKGFVISVVEDVNEMFLCVPDLLTMHKLRLAGMNQKVWTRIFQKTPIYVQQV